MEGSDLATQPFHVGPRLREHAFQAGLFSDAGIGVFEDNIGAKQCSQGREVLYNFGSTLDVAG